MNLVCGPVGQASAVLLRAGEVVAGADVARSRRTTSRAERDLASGPARLTVALGVDKALNGADAVDPASSLRVLAGAPPARAVRAGPRVGVAGEGAGHPWRFWSEGEPSVSAYRPAVARRRRTAGAGESAS
jgi:DNA-3-methyladenine glycosylase